MFLKILRFFSSIQSRKLWWLIFGIFFTGYLIGCNSDNKISNSLLQDPDIQVYFNHRQNNKYKDPYRKFKRSGDNLESVIIEGIKEANESIDIAVQELQLPKVAEALVKAYRSSVKVRVILDNNYSRSWSKLNPGEIKKLNKNQKDKYQRFINLVDRDRDGNLSDKEIQTRDSIFILQNAGIPIIDDTEDGSKGSGIMHHKFIVIDKKFVITGSANFTLSGIHGDLDSDDTRGNVNHLLRINNFLVADLFTEEFNYMWGDGKEGNKDSKFGLDKEFRSPQTISWDNSKITIQFSPTSKKQDWEDSTNGLIGKTLNSANSSIDIALFVFSEQQLADILQKQNNSGIQIKALIDRSFAFRYYSEALDMLGYSLARKNSCTYEQNNNPWENSLSNVGTVRLATGDKLHHKMAIIDNKTIITGSQNWSATANINNDEAVLIITNDKVAQHFKSEFDRLYQTSILGLSRSVKQKIDRQQDICN